MGASINIGDSWKSIVNVTDIKINISDVWKNANTVYINIGDVWKIVNFATTYIGVVNIAAGFGTAYYLKTDNTFWGWGDNTYGKIGNNSTNPSYTPVSILGVAKVFQVFYPGTNHIAAIDNGGKVWTWGLNANGQLGINSTTSKNTPVSILGVNKTFCQISAGISHTVAIDKNGRAWGWGLNSSGQLGDFTAASKNTPVSVKGVNKTFCQIASGDSQNLAIDKYGRAWGWGVNTYGQLGDNSATARCTPVSVLGVNKTFCKIESNVYHTVAIDKYGRAWGWGLNTSGQLGNFAAANRCTPVSVLGVNKTFCQITNGTGHTLAIDKYGRIWGWGTNSYGELGNNSLTQRCTPVSVMGVNKTFCQISAGNYYSLAVDSNGNSWAWGAAFYGVLGFGELNLNPYIPGSVLGITKTFCNVAGPGGGNFSVGLNNNGRVWTWGANANGQLGDYTAVNKSTPVSVLGVNKTFCKISSGVSHVVALDKYGRAWGWGINTYSQLGDNSVTQRCTPVSVLGVRKTFCEISTRANHTIALDYNGNVWSWGYTNKGLLGIGAFNNPTILNSIVGVNKTFCKITTINTHVLTIDKNGRVWGWGTNSVGQIGDNTVVARCSPVSALGVNKTFCTIETAWTHSLAIDKYGRAWVWGVNTSGQLGVNSTASKSTPVSVLGVNKTFCRIDGGEQHSVAIDKYGRVWCWGLNSSGQLGTYSTTNKSTPQSILGVNKTFCIIVAGRNTVHGISNNNVLWSWGVNTFGQLGDRSITARCTPVSVLGVQKTFCQIAAAECVLAIDKYGRAWGWGANSYGALGNNSATSKSTPVSVLGVRKTFCKIATSYGGHTAAIDKNGRVWTWGYNNLGQLGNGTFASQRTPISVYMLQTKTFCEITTGIRHTLAIDNNGRVWGWGSGSSFVARNINTATPIEITTI